MRNDRDRWNKKFANGSEPTEPQGEPELIANESLLPRAGLATELACGRGRNALYLATLGLDVVAIDGAINGLRRCQRGASRRGLSVMPTVMDLDHAVLKRQSFSMISVIRYLNRDLFHSIMESLAPDGMLFYKTFNRRHLNSSPGFNPDYLLADGELVTAFSALDIIQHDEAGESSWLLAKAP